MNGRLIATLVLLGCIGSTGCAPMMIGSHGHPHPHVAPSQPQLPPIGRWDLVMSLQQNLVITVIDASGVRHTGRFVAADRHELRLVTHGQDVSVARGDVMRVDLAQRIPAGKNTVRRIALSAAGGALAHAGFIGLIGTGMGDKLWIPPLKYWLAGAGVGAVLGAERDVRDRRPRTIYVAPPFRTY